MKHPLQITFRHMNPSPAAETLIREEMDALHQYFERITSCRVVVEMPHRRHQRGNEFHVSIDMHVPGSQIVVNHTPSLHSTLVGTEAEELEKSQEAQPDHKDLYISIRDAFAAARRQLEDYASVLRGETKRHAREAAMAG